jgi:hypothetical protein
LAKSAKSVNSSSSEKLRDVSAGEAENAKQNEENGKASKKKPLTQPPRLPKTNPKLKIAKQ